jgi:hypothetical protein
LRAGRQESYFAVVQAADETKFRWDVKVRGVHSVNAGECFAFSTASNRHRDYSTYFLFSEGRVKDLTGILSSNIKLIGKILLSLFSNAGRDNAILTEPTASHANGLKTRRLSSVGIGIVRRLYLVTPDLF